MNPTGLTGLEDTTLGSALRGEHALSVPAEDTDGSWHDQEENENQGK
jgi:hypothetical protein